MRIFAFARRYPIPYKPYYDAQFGDLIRQGHDLTIFSGGRLDQVENETVSRFGLGERTRHFPMTLRDVPMHMPRFIGSLVAQPVNSGRVVLRAGASVRKLNRRLVNTVRAVLVGREKPDFCLIHGLGTAVMFSWLRDVFEGVPVAMYYHGGEVPSSNPFEEAAVADAFNRVDLVFTNTEFSRQHAIERGCPSDRIVILPVGFCLADFVPQTPRSYRPKGTLRLLSAGRMSEEKGFIYALEALKQLIDRGITDISYSLTGEGYLRPQLEKFVRENKLESYVHFLGTLSTDGVIRAMGDSDALLLPSIQVGNWVENQACAVQEAMLMKALVITTTTGGVPESIPPEMRRYTAPEKDAARLADVIAGVHALSTEDLARLGETCRSFVVRNYDVTQLNRELIDKTQRAASERHRWRNSASSDAIAPHRLAVK
jgi:glycosyltransferase involved in cell wall biosynthesis